MSSSGLTGTIAVTSEALMQDFKAGQIIGSNSKNLTIAQLIAAPVGSMATGLIAGEAMVAVLLAIPAATGRL
jgi:uncharacterized oligopeptide transporter (OPT) family protein